MTEISATDISTLFRCQHCGRDFRRESTLFAHVCEQKRRFRDRGDRAVIMGMQAYLRFYEITQGSARLKTWPDFETSSYYRAFVKFGRYCQTTRCINVLAFTDWLIKTNAKLDHWCRDSIYEQYLLQYLRREPVADALTRSIETAVAWQERTGNASTDYLRFGNDNLICNDIVRGRAAPWAVYNCDSGLEFLDRITTEQVTLIWPWIDADVWQRVFADHPADQAYAQQILAQAGW